MNSCESKDERGKKTKGEEDGQKTAWEMAREKAEIACAHVCPYLEDDGEEEVDDEESADADDQEEEDDHQAVVDPVMQIHV